MNHDIYNTDVLAGLGSLENESIDVIFTSPPYNLKNSTGGGMKNGNGGKILKFPSISISEPNVILSAFKPGEWMRSTEKDRKEGKEEQFTESKDKQYLLIKNAEHWKWDGKHIILRVYEAIGRKSIVKIIFNDFSSNFSLKSVEMVDLLERKVKKLDSLEDNYFSFDIAPFEILTFRVLFDFVE